MKKLTAEDLRNLKIGTKVYRCTGRGFRGLHFVGIMQPADPNYLIFCDGEHLEHLYISRKDDSFHDTWYGGEYDSKFVGELKIKQLEREIESVKEIYIKD